MNPQRLVLIVSVLILIPSTLRAIELSPKRAPETKLNQVYVKVIMPGDPVDLAKDRPVVESWISENLKKRGQDEFTAVTRWVPLDLSPLEATDVWNGVLGKHSYCPVGADIERTEDPIITIHLSGWSPGGAFLDVRLRDEVGSRVIVAVKDLELEEGMPYVAILIGPPLETPTASTGRKIATEITVATEHEQVSPFWLIPWLGFRGSVSRCPLCSLWLLPDFDTMVVEEIVS